MTENTDTTFDEPTENHAPDNHGRPAERYAELGALAAVLVLAAVASVGFYLSTTAAIDRLVARQYEPLFQAVFNLLLLLVAAIGLSLLWRRR